MHYLHNTLLIWISVDQSHPIMSRNHDFIIASTCQIILWVINSVSTQNVQKNYHFLTPETHMLVFQNVLRAC